MEVLVGRVYKHYKGDYYIVENIAIHSETGEKMVIYRALYEEGKVFVVFATDYFNTIYAEKIKKRNIQSLEKLGFSVSLS